MIRRGLALTGVALALACSDAPPPELPGAALRQRAAERLVADREALSASIGHYGLVSDVATAELDRFLARIVPRRRGPDIVMGSAYGIELHGGGVLGILAEYWEPEGRPARLDDRYGFPASRQAIPLQAIYDAHKRQLFIPPGEPPGALTLPRMRLGYALSGGAGSTEVDAFTFLSLLVRFEDDLNAPWTNDLGQSLSGERALGLAWDRYLEAAERAETEQAAVEFEDHSYLHLPEILLAYARRAPGRDPDAIKRRFLSSELQRTEYGGYDATEALGHYADTLGTLLEDPRISFSEAESAQVIAWLSRLDEAWPRSLERVPAQHLAHLQKGLDSIERNAHRLR